jgi:hypothetical protein
LAQLIRANSLRAKFGTDKVKNAVHCTDLVEDGVLEVILCLNLERIFLWNLLKQFNKILFIEGQRD